MYSSNENFNDALGKKISGRIHQTCTYDEIVNCGHGKLRTSKSTR